MLAKIQKIASAHSRNMANIASFVGTRLISIVAFAVSVPFFIRHTSEAQYAAVAIGFSLLGLSTLLDVAIGYVITQSVGRRLARARQPDIRMLNGLFAIYLYLACSLAVAMILIMGWLPLQPKDRMYFGCLALLLPGMAISGVVAAIYQARNDLSYINFSRFGFEVGKAAALIISAYLSNDYSLIGPTLVGIIVIRAACDYLSLRGRTGIALKMVSFRKALAYRKFARIGLPSFGIVILTLLVTICDKLLIKNLFSENEVAYYSIAFDVNAKAYLLVNAVNMAMFAIILRQFSKKSTIKAPVVFGLLTVAFVGCVYYIPMFFYSDVLISLLVSPNFADKSAHMASIMSIASMLYLFGNVFENAATAMGAAKNILYVYLVGIIVYFGSLSFLSSKYGVEGFVLGYVLLCFVLCSGFILVYLRKFNQPLLARTSI